MTITFAEKLARMPGYQAGVPTGQAPEAIASGNIAQLASNESPTPPHPKVVEAVAAAAGLMNRYPDPDATLLRRRLAERYETEPSRVAVGNGSCEILLAAAEIAAFCERIPSHVTVILDEAYVEFQTHDDPDATLDLLADFPNLVVVRTFS